MLVVTEKNKKRINMDILVKIYIIIGIISMLSSEIYATDDSKFLDLEYFVDCDNSKIDLLDVSLKISKIINPSLGKNYYIRAVNK